ncbi:electron transfer flavoprotein beta subunit [Angulomicrobium tetraedrale]|uniref:Electron transfer flavoprotein beta subunit n=1 Tax=Ancylobacter tetraedralis TaxID=217068 RepID=A0A839ZEV8_9HYPH|nr:electron transfer flavoprotein subunit beta/FixA family protein [Ancylobacter tetraedralis]MBB3773430.1 electron transfer flavoprotein beta subunit [Ancylobacter tetraedralis]
MDAALINSGAPLHIVVLLKQVFDPSTPPDRIAIGADHRSISVGAGLTPVMNGYDANALEEAIRLKERHGASVTAISLGEEQASTVVRRALALGADAGVLVVAPAGLGQGATFTAALLSAALKRLPKADLVLCGRASSDTDAGQVPAIVAAALDAPLILPVSAVLSSAEDHIVVERLSDRGVQRLKSAFPCVLGVSNEANTPRPPSLKGVMTAKKAPLTIWNSADLSVETAPAVTLQRLSARENVPVDIEIIAGSPAEAGARLAERLVEAEFVR